MSSSFLLKAGAFALAYAGVVSGDKKYTCSSADTYEGTSFFDKFDFFTDIDPTRGYVQYQSRDVAQSTHFGGELVKVTNNQAYIGVDYWNQYEPYGAGRPSIRLESKTVYNHGLFVLDVAHMPASVCGTWPAFWTFSDVNYPAQGEIDILENVHEETVGLNVLHTSPGFSVAGNQKGSVQTGTQSTYSCDDTAESSLYGSQYTGQGCVSTNTDSNSYGSSLNAVGGGVYAMEWTSDVISVWNFAAANIPADLKSGSPDTSKWGLPTFTTTGGIGDIDSHFKDHKMVIDTTFCGNWAGQDSLWQATSCYDADKYPTCSTYVAANPAKYADAYWLINSVKVYQKTEATVSDLPVSSTSISASSSATSSSISLSTGVHYTNASSIAAPTPTGGDVPLTTSTVYTTRTGTVTKCPATVTNCPVGAITTETIALYTTICPVSAEATPTPTLTGGSDLPLTTSTIFSTKTGTVTACPVSITNCPLGSVTTEIIAVSTTVCPGNPTVANIASTTAVNVAPTGTGIPGSPSCGGVGSPACPQGNSAGVSSIPVNSSSPSNVVKPSSVGVLEISPIASVPESAKPTSVSENSGNSGNPGVSASAACGGAGCPVAAKPTSVSGNSGFSAAASPSCVGEGCGGVAKPTSFVYAPTKSAGNGTAAGTGTLTLGSITLATGSAPITTNGSGALRVGSGFALVVGLIAALVM